jgi:hypothetical protein
MASTITLAGDWLMSLGNKRCVNGTGNLGTYATSGIAVTAAQCGLGVLDELVIPPVSGYNFMWNKTTGMVLAYRVPAITATGSGIVDESPGGGDIKGSANTDAENADAASLPTNGALYLAATAVSVLAGTMTPTTQPDVARNVGIFVTNDTGGNLNLYEGVTTFTVTGTWRGAAQTEAITITSTSGNKAVAHTPNYRYKYGVKPFSSITSVTYDNAPAATLKLSLGPGSKIGLYNDLLTPLEADVIKLTKNAANLATTSIVNTTYMTVNFGALADGDDIAIVYKTALGVAAQQALAEVTTGTNLAGVTFRFLAIGF